MTVTDGATGREISRNAFWYVVFMYHLIKNNLRGRGIQWSIPLVESDRDFQGVDIFIQPIANNIIAYEREHAQEFSEEIQPIQQRNNTVGGMLVEIANNTIRSQSVALEFLHLNAKILHLCQLLMSKQRYPELEYVVLGLEDIYNNQLRQRIDRNNLRWDTLPGAIRQYMWSGIKLN